MATIATAASGLIGMAIGAVAGPTAALAFVVGMLWGAFIAFGGLDQARRSLGR